MSATASPSKFLEKRDKEKDRERGGSQAFVSAGGMNRGRKVYFEHRRFENNGKEEEDLKSQIAKWRMKERMKTVGVALVCCLNIGVDPPDVVKASPCARLECWIEPTSEPPQKALEAIGNALQAQYERWQPRARYKLCTDPTVDDVKKLCTSMRRSSKDERVLFHYNGHGVPKPTNNGEIWVFNKSYTQYIPLSIYELQSWMESPSIYVFDCSAAGLILQWYTHFAEQRTRESEKESRSAAGASSSPPVSPSSLMHNSILLAACSASETLPANPQFPADVFTACLTTPIKMALRWFCSINLNKNITPDLADKVPGRITDRRTVLGQLNWIFTAITDTIAWNVLPPPLFQKLFRQDLLVASLFRNFLLAERIMRSAKCTPLSVPKLPNTANHPMWRSWDLAVDLCLSHLATPKAAAANFPPITFFEDQLTAFEVWLQFASEQRIRQNRIPEQLPIVLQVLLSQSHRHRALVLLAKFLDLGLWAVNLALSVGIFPYVVKLLQSPSAELRQVLVFIWAKILAMDKSCQLDLVKDNGHSYFVSVLSTSHSNFSPATSSPPSSSSFSASSSASTAAHFITTDSESLADDQTLSAFVLAVICDNCRPGQIACLGCGLLPLCLSLIADAHPLLRCWLVFCLGKLWEDYEDAKVAAIREGAHEKLCALLTDSSTEVRAAAVYSIGTFLANAGSSEARRNIELNIGLTLPVVTGDASPLVRKELVISLHYLVEGFKDRFQEAVTDLYEDEGTFRRQDSRLKPKRSPAPPSEKLDGGGRQLGSVYDCIWKVLVGIRTDPYPEVAQLANGIANEVLKSAGIGPLNSSGSTVPLHSSGSGITAPDQSPASAWKSRAAPTTAPRGRRNILGSLSVRLEKEEEESAPAPDPFQQIADETRSLFRRIGVDSPASGPSASSANLTSTPSQPVTPLRGQDLEASPPQDRTGGSDSAAGHVELRSSLFNWSCGRFSSPLLRPLEEDTTSPSFLRKLWRNKRRKDVLADVTKAARTGYRRMDDQIAILDNNIEHTSLLTFHPFEDVLITCNLFDQIGVWSWKEGVSGVRTAFFSNNNAPGSLLTGIQLINDHDQPLIMTSSSDGVVRIWEHPSVSNPSDPTTYVTGGKMNTSASSSTPYQSVPPKLVTSFKALIDLPSNVKVIGSNLVIDWQQDSGVLAISGDVSIIRVWNLERELHSQDISASPDACVSCLTNDNPAGRTIIAGYEDGYIRMFDQRSANSRYAAALSFQEEKSRILRIHRSKLDINVAVSGSLDGVIKIWDLRRTAQSVKSIDCLKGQASAYAVHDYLPLIAVGSQSQKIKVFNFEGDILSLMRYHDGFLGQRIGPISCLNFHPFKPYLGAGARDSIVSIYRGASS